ncbi:hypothetical protein AVEN_72807-1 [Araneus ventricosus]|uniref:Uncharacterized protein n=1 Tax=Araneus ventricosus TaxID=182803 RepID=A0A4Y2WJ85_ARAVE|nr:hypothetical protein AVEN_72807-1 [Araneus ventricosus]
MYRHSNIAIFRYIAKHEATRRNARFDDWEILQQTKRFASSILEMSIFIVFIRGHIGIHRISTTIRASQRATLLDESRCKKHGERFATATTDDRGIARACDHRCEIGNNALRGACGHRCLRCIGKYCTHRG